MLRLVAPLVALGLIAFGARSVDARACHVPPVALDSRRDTAAWCAREFLVRNGYTDAPPSTDRDAIALEPTMDIGNSMAEMLEARHSTVSGTPLLSCTTNTGYLVSFSMPNQLNALHGRGVAMTGQFLGITLLRAWVELGKGVQPNCIAPRIPGP